MQASQNNVALVTGAARRIGRAISLHLARRGWNVALHCHRSTAEAQTLRQEIVASGGKATVIEADLLDAEAVGRIVPQAAQALGTVTLLVHNASLFEKGDLASFTEASFTRHMQVNCQAGLMLLKDLEAALPDTARAHAVMLTDGAYGWSVSPQFLSYALSKQALERAVTLLAPALAPRIRLNAIAPGATLPGHMDKPDTFEKIRAITPMKTVSSPQELCGALDFLIDTPSVTGQVIALNGGLGL